MGLRALQPLLLNDGEIFVLPVMESSEVTLEWLCDVGGCCPYGRVKIKILWLSNEGEETPRNAFSGSASEKLRN